jgi:hypothetical protein
MRLTHNLWIIIDVFTRRLQNVNTGKRNNRHYNASSLRAVDVSNVGRKPPSVFFFFFSFLFFSNPIDF